METTVYVRFHHHLNFFLPTSKALKSYFDLNIEILDRELTGCALIIEFENVDRKVSCIIFQLTPSLSVWL